MPNNRVTVRIWWNNNPSFYMSQNPSDHKQYRLKITDATLHVTVLTPSPDLKKALYPRVRADNLKEKVDAVYYHYQETVVLTESIMTVSSYLSQNLAKNGITPNRIYIVFVKSDSFGGHRNKSPFDFRHVMLTIYWQSTNLCSFRRLFEVTEREEERGPAHDIAPIDEEMDGDISDSETAISAGEFRAALEAVIQESGNRDVVNRGMVRRTWDGLRDKLFRKKGPGKSSTRRDSVGSAGTGTSLPGTSAAASGSQTPATRRQVAAAAAAVGAGPRLPGIPPSYHSTESISQQRYQGEWQL